MPVCVGAPGVAKDGNEQGPRDSRSGTRGSDRTSEYMDGAQLRSVIDLLANRSDGCPLLVTGGERDAKRRRRNPQLTDSRV